MCISTLPNFQRHDTAPGSCDLNNLLSNSFFQNNLDSTIELDIRNINKISEAHFVVQHDYHDHANEQKEKLSENRPCKGGVTTPFPIKLHEMLDRVEEDGNAHIVSWQPHGRCFVVHKPKDFKELLPNYFKLSKMASFQRQLNLYGFSRLTRGKDKGGYYHELFLRDRQFLANKIQRIKVKGTGVRARSNPGAEPDFWQMSWVGCGTASVESKDNASNTSNSVVSDESISNSSNQSLNSSTIAAEVPEVPSSSQLPAIQALSIPASNDILFPPQNATKLRRMTLADCGLARNSEENEDLWTFGGKRFHYLDPFQMLANEQRSPSNYSSNGNYTDEMETFISDLQLETLCSDINRADEEDDAAFIDLLERVIS